MATTTHSSKPRGYGEPLELRGHAMYFTSWKYIRQGGWHWPSRQVYDPTDPLAAVHMQQEAEEGKPSPYLPKNLPRGLRLVAQKAAKMPLDLSALHVSDGFAGINTVLQDQGVYKMWYVIRGGAPTIKQGPFQRSGQLGYAESTDAIHWQPKAICEGLTRGHTGGSVFIDPTNTDERFKMIHNGMLTDDEQAAFDAKYPGQACPMARRTSAEGKWANDGMFASVSPDGIHWTPREEPIMVHFADTRNTCYYDLDRRQYVAYVRIWEANPQQPDMVDRYTVGWGGVGRRAIGRATSDDFRHFSKAEIVVATSADMAPSHLWYNNAKTTLPGCPDQHVMFPWRWEMERDGGDTFLFSTNDGWAWSQVPGGPVLECGLPGTPDGEYVVASGSMIELPEARWAVPYHGYSVPHKYPAQNAATRKGLFPGVPHVQGYATWPKGRLVALESQDGEFATVAVVPPTNRIRLNATVRPAGFLKVAVQKLRAEDIPHRDFDSCDTLVGDSTAMPVTWHGEATLNHANTPIILRFRLRHAKLFGVEFF